MQLIILPLIALMLFYIDTLINSIWPFTIFGIPYFFRSHLLLMYLLIITVYKNPKIALILGVLFGCISDIYLGTIYGIYLFGFIIAILMMDQLFKVFYKDLKMMMVLFLAFIFIFEHFYYIVFAILGIAHINYFVFIWTHVLPSLILNFALILLVFPIILKILDKYAK
ncbi:rod shape-determining protein MreD [Macrococcoides caseolyticum]|uniref:rod shape-determining protein MreD n=1 Tax=Macrococcoides caseolyticum TaxID=69966 RepID=UPI001F3F3D20|nr:rod shape-determining protein MreD [Macrococcus caseolyticus]MCE4956222.1 rod shape-determining protein MreD [Macrococcus caseolyticus]